MRAQSDRGITLEGPLGALIGSPGAIFAGRAMKQAGAMLRVGQLGNDAIGMLAPGFPEASFASRLTATSYFRFRPRLFSCPAFRWLFVGSSPASRTLCSERQLSG
jgi:hypothetical protein